MGDRQGRGLSPLELEWLAQEVRRQRAAGRPCPLPGQCSLFPSADQPAANSERTPD